MELYAPPISEGNLKIDKKGEESFVVDRPFYLAITHSAIEEALETPLLVASVGHKYWRKQ
jgi:hypothetical protein